MNKIPLYAKILIGMTLGILLGFLAHGLGFGMQVTDWVSPWGTIFIRLLKLVAVPLVFVSLVKGICNLRDIKRLSRIGVKTLVIYVGTTVAAISIGMVLVSLIRPGDVFPQEKSNEYRQKYEQTVLSRNSEVQVVKDASPLRFVVDIVPDNAIKGLGDNSGMLQVIFMAMIFGIAMIAVGEEKTATVRAFFDGANDIILKIIDYIMAFSPWGVMALMAGLVVDFSGDTSIFAALGAYALTLTAALLIIVVVFYPLLLRCFTKIKPGKFFRAILPAQMLAFSTSSSAATLPVTMEQTQKELGVPNEIASFVLPVGVTVNMDGTSCYQAVATVFIAQVLGIDLSFTQMLVIVLIATISSIGTPGIPGGSVVMLMMVLSSVGIPAQGMALIMGIDRPLDMMRTVVNVTGDSTVACIIAEGDRKKSLPLETV